MNERPLITGKAADRARHAAKRFSTAILARPRRGGFDLCSGAAGLALVHAGLEQAFPGLGHARRAQQALSAAIRALSREVTDGSLGAGFAGVAWVAEILCGGDGSADGNVDTAIEGLLAERRGRGPYDLLAGLAGLGVYALERTSHPSARRILARVVDAFGTLSVPRANGVSWRTDDADRPALARELGFGEWDLGVAHGTPGVIAVLGRVCASAADAPTKRRARALLDGAVSCLLAQELPADSGGGFPAATRDGAAPTRARSAWCYGDPGIAAALLVAAQGTGETVWAREAQRIAIAAASRRESDCGVWDAGLCHGAAGLGHVYHRLYRGTGDERLARAAKKWMMTAVGMSEPEAPFVWNAHDGPRGVSLPGFLTGGGGIALALLAATGDADAAWDRALCISASEAERAPQGQTIAPTSVPVFAE